MADSRHVPTDAVSRAHSRSNSNDKNNVDETDFTDQNNGSNSHSDGCYCNCKSRNNDANYRTKWWLLKYAGKGIDDPEKNENGEDTDYRNNDDNNYEAGIQNDDNHNSDFYEDNNRSLDEGCVEYGLVENGDYDSSSTEGCDDDDLIEDCDVDNDGPTEDCNVDNDGTAGGRDDGGNGSTERGDTDAEQSETLRKSAFSRFLERSNAFIRHMIRKAFDPTQ